MGNVVQAGDRPEPGAPGGAQRRPARSRRRADDQQGVRLRPEGGDARRAGHRDRRHRHRRRRRHGVDEQRARTCCRACAKACAWATATVVDSMINDGLWCAFEQLPHGHVRRGRRRALHGRPRRRRTRTPPRAISKAAHATREGWFTDEILPVAIPQKKGDADRRRSRRSRSAPTRPPRRSPR